MSMPNEQPPGEDEQRITRRPAGQDQRLAKSIQGARRTLLTLRQKPDALEKMAAHGYDDAKLAQGMALSEKALAAFHMRSDAVALKQQASEQLRDIDLTAREVYADFKTACRPLFPSHADWMALSVDGNTPGTRVAFILKARDAYASAQRHPYIDQLRDCGFGPDDLQEAEDSLDRLEHADSVYQALSNQAKEAYLARDAAAAELRLWMFRFGAVLKVALKGRPSLAEILPED